VPRATVSDVSEQQLLFDADFADDDAPLPSSTPPSRPAVQAAPQVEVVRSTRRRRTISAHRVGDRIVVSVPARLSRAEEARWVALMVERVLAGERRQRPSDDELMTRAAALSERYLDGRAVPSSVRWVDNMASRWGSCTPVDGTIRLSRRLAGMPAYVIDYVLLHELAHLLVPGHGRAFWQVLAGYERLERARGFLEGVEAAQAG
jgi:predicted metal-dependent hydrolase